MKAILAVGILAVSLPVLAQSTDRFEVASVRRADIPNSPMGVPVFPTTGGPGPSDPGRITYRGVWLFSLIAQAFGVRPDQVIAPDWLTNDRYDIIANYPKGITRAQFNVMLGNLLRDRFNLRFHMGSKDLPVYALQLGTGGITFKETSVKVSDAQARPTGRDAQGFPIVPPDYQGAISFPIDGQIFMTAQDVPISALVSFLEPRAGRPVVDETGLTGRYDFRIHMEWLGRGAGVAPTGAPNIFTAVEEQLGLKLEPVRRPLPQLVIDSIDREATAN